jgi:uncharacterized protein YndB with AHSA1/START domain
MCRQRLDNALGVRPYFLNMRCALLGLFIGIAAFAQSDPSFVNEGDINAPIDAVWRVWSTGEGYRMVGVAIADVDLRIGGLIRSHYAATGALGDDDTIENRILAYEPKRMIALRIEKPPKSFPFKEAWRHTWTVVTLTELGPRRTHVRVASMGFGTDAESIAMQKFFEVGNASTLKTLQSRLETR